jgi:outer membrane protein OmpA-like peptidoglycan-associated protein
VFEEEDKETGYAVFLAVTLAIVVAAFAVAVAIGTAIGRSGGGASAPAAAPPAPSIIRIVGLVFFDADKAEAPADVTMLLRPALRFSQVMPASKLIVAAYYDAGGDAAAGAELARRRAASVRDALVASGIGAQRIELAGPLATAGGEEGRDARRVEVTLR